MTELTLNPNDVRDYETFLKVKSLPVYRVRGRQAWFPDEYASRLGIAPGAGDLPLYTPQANLFDYQAAIAEMAIRKQKFGVFADPGWGKTFILAEFARYVLGVLPESRRVLLVSPLMVCPQTISEIGRFYGGSLPLEQRTAGNLPAWLEGEGGRFAITNFEAIKGNLPQGQLGALLVDEMMKDMYGTYVRRLIRLGRGIQWKLVATGTPAPNDRIEYGTHAVFLDQFPTLNSFLAKYFVNRGQTDNRWELKPHALRPFYRDLSHWSFFMNNPATYGWKDNATAIPPIHVHIHEVPLTKEQRAAVGKLTRQVVATKPGGIAGRGKLAQIAKGILGKKRIPTNKYDFMRDLVAGWPEESTLIWCWYDPEQDSCEGTFADAASIRGKTPLGARLSLIDEFKSRQRPQLISKPKILGLGLNLQVATRQVFSSLIDSYEKYAQAVKRSNRVGSVLDLNVHIPLTEIEEPMVDTVLRKAGRVAMDAAEQEAIFKEQWSA